MKTLISVWNARRMLAVLAVLSLPNSLLACTVCYGQTDSPMAQAMSWGILTLLGVIASVLLGVAAFFVHVCRRAARSAESAGLTNTTTT